MAPSPNRQSSTLHETLQSAGRRLGPLFVYAARSLQYLYYLRIALALWLIIPVIAAIDGFSHPISLLHAIFTPEKVGQFLGAAFFLACSGWVALLLARVVGFNGSARFRSPQEIPRWVDDWLGVDSEHRVLPLLIIAQLPNLLVFYVLHKNAVREGVHLETSLPFPNLLSMLAGVVLAVAFWYIVTAIYYWTFPYAAFKRSARTLLFPRWVFLLGALIPPERKDGTIETHATVQRVYHFRLIEWVFERFAALGPGYSCSSPTPDCPAADCQPTPYLWEAHRLAILGLIGTVALYVILFPLTAPTPNRPLMASALALATLLYAFLVSIFTFSEVSPDKEDPPTAQAPPNSGVLRPSEPSKNVRLLRVILVNVLGLSTLVCLFWLIRLLANHTPSTPAPGLTELWFRPPLQFFPVLATVAVLLTLVAFLLGGVCFFLDRYSFPVFITFVVGVALLHVALPPADHYFNAFPRDGKSRQALTPFQLLQARCSDTHTPCNLIVVTATGGGMHAAVWSSSILAALEQGIAAEHKDTDRVPSFHDNLFFASTVSGGSFGLAAFLREYKAAQPFAPAASPNSEPAYTARIRQATSCSTLEAVAWGLEYADFLHILFPALPFSSDDDRSNALQLASARNYTEPKCSPDRQVSPQTGLPDPATTHDLSLARLTPQAGIQPFPAFTMNTTEVETGGRVLLANYVNDSEDSQFNVGVSPASSFLDIYGHSDIDLLTAARLSATYPVVSSAARISASQVPGPAPHYVDGGYYDNDGVASMVEFLTQAFALNSSATASPGGVADPQAPCSALPVKSGATPAHQKVRSEVQLSALSAQPNYTTKSDLPCIHILLVEIRDGQDVDATNSPEGTPTMLCSPDVKCHDYGTLGQIEAPLNAFWLTGHGSVSRRNRRELTILRHALSGRTDIQEVVFPYDAYTPLSWHLTPSETTAIRKQIETDRICRQKGCPYGQVMAWVHGK